MGIGFKIKELARKENISLSDLAKRLGKTKQAVYEMVEKEDVNTSILRKLCAEFNIPITYFFQDSNIKDTETKSITESDNKSKNTFLEERVKHLEELLSEKERLIKVLMDVRK